MKSTRKGEEVAIQGIALEVPSWPGEGSFTLRMVEWENGEGFDFHFPDGVITVTDMEFRAMQEVYLKQGRESLLRN